MAKQRSVEIILKATDKTGSAFKSVDSNIEKTGKAGKAGAVAMTAIGVAAAAAAVAVVASMAKIATSFVNGLKEATALGDSFDKMSKRIDVSVESLSNWSFIIKRAGGDISVLETAFRGLARQMKAAQDGTTLTVDAFGDLGVEFANADGSLRGVEETFNDLITALGKHTNEAEKSAFALQFFGRAGLGLKPVISQTNEELEKQKQLVIDIGGVYSKEYTDGAAALTDAFDLFERQAHSLQRQLIATYGQDVAVLVEHFATTIGAIKSDIEGSIDPTGDLMMALAEGLDAVMPAMNRLLTSFNLIKQLAEIQLKQNVSPFGPAISDYAKLLSLMKEWGELSEELGRGQGSAVKALEDARARREAMEGIEAQYQAHLKSLEATTTAEDNLTEAVKAEAEIEMERANARSDAFDKELYWAEWKKERQEEAKEKEAAALQRLIDMTEATEEMSAETVVLANAMRSMVSGMENAGAAALSSFIKGEKSARSFASTLMNVVVDALSAVIIKLLIIKTLSALGIPFFSEGGQVSTYAQGGQVAKIPKAAFGYSVPDGPRGFDSRLIMAMPGEEVINRSMSRRLNRFLSAAEASAYVSPYDVVGSQGGGGNTVVMNVGIPQSQAGLVEMQQSIVEMLDDREKGVL